MKIEAPTPLDSLAAVLIEGAEALGTPMRGACLFSDHGMAVIDGRERSPPAGVLSPECRGAGSCSQAMIAWTYSSRWGTVASTCRAGRRRRFSLEV